MPCQDLYPKNFYAIVTLKEGTAWDVRGLQIMSNLHVYKGTRFDSRGRSLASYESTEARLKVPTCNSQVFDIVSERHFGPLF